MRSGTSCSKTLIRSDWRRFWPVGFLYAFISFFMLPMPLWINRRAVYIADYAEPGAYGAVADRAVHVAETVMETIPGFVILGFFFGLVLAMAVYAYLMSGKSVGLMHALPVSRDRQFLSHFAAGLSMLTAANCLTFLLALLMEAMTGGAAVGSLLLWLVITELTGFFFLAFATLACVVTGWLLAVPVIYAGWNFMVWAYDVILRALAGLLYPSYGDGVSFGTAVDWLTPVVKLTQETSRRYVIIPPEGALMGGVSKRAMAAVLIYAAVGVVMLALACVLNRARQSETAGDAIAFRPLRPVARYVISIAAGLALGTLVYEMVSSGGRNAAGMIAWQLIMGGLVYCAVEMLLRKTYKIFDRRTAAGLLALWLVLAGTCLAMKYDVTGVEKRVPQPDRVERADVYVFAAGLPQTTVSDGETLQAVVELHELLIQRRDMEARDGKFGVNYRLKSGGALSRRYNVDLSDLEVRAAVEKLMNRPEIKRQLVLEDLGRYGEQFTGGYAGNYAAGKEMVLTPAQCLALYRAMEADMLSNRLTVDQRVSDNIGIELNTTEGTYRMWQVRESCVNTLAVLQEIGLIESADELFR